MAISPISKYPAQVDTDSHYPYGKARNKSGSSSNDGSPLEKDMLNDVWGFQQALLVSAGIAPSGTPEASDASQYLSALQAIFAPKNRYLVAQGTPAGAFSSFARSDNTYAGISNADFDVSGTAVGDVVEGDYLFSLTLGAGYCTFKLACNDESGEVVALERQISQAGPVILPFRYVVTTAGLAGVVPYLKGDGTNTATIHPFYQSGIFGRYHVIRP